MTDTPDTDTDTIIRAALESEGIDVDQLERRRDEILSATLPVLTAARNVADGVGTPGGLARYTILRGALDNLRAKDPTSAIVIAAAVWTDCYGTGVAPVRLVELQEAVDALLN